MDDIFDNEVIPDADFSHFQLDSNNMNVMEAIKVLSENEEVTLTFDNFYTKTDKFADGTIKIYDKNIYRTIFIVKKGVFM